MKVKILQPKKEGMIESIYNNIKSIDFDHLNEYDIKFYDEDYNLIKSLRSEDILYISELIIIRKAVLKE